MTQPRIAILDDEPEIRAMLTEALTEAGFATQSFSRAAAFEAALNRQSFDLCLVDLGLPDRDGLVLVHRLALEAGAAIIIISGRSAVQDRITGLELGADDYIIKPFDPTEIVARVRARLRKPRARITAQSDRAQFDRWTAHFDRYVLQPDDGDDVALSHAEGQLLRLFLENPKRLISRAQMQESLGGGAGESFDRAIDVRISRLRTKLGEDPRNPVMIKTIYGAGYIFVSDVVWQ